MTYELAIANLALQIQAQEKPTFYKIFVSLGSFHLKMAFFSALRKIIEEPGGTNIPDECKFWRKVQLILF